ncbi:hypothetical protein cypCar_00032495 [Cyprinus carpio]|nr:hypothetical protein cypCar_00032495 [Cyprinus carpio]
MFFFLCRCKEGYRGLRCDQFVPKTDSILSDPSMYFCHSADELGIEFMALATLGGELGILIAGCSRIAGLLAEEPMVSPLRRQPASFSAALKFPCQIRIAVSPWGSAAEAFICFYRSCSFSSSPALKHKVTNYRAVSKWTPPISRAGHHLSGGSRDSLHSYKHLQEVEVNGVIPQSLRRCQSHSDRNQQSRGNLNMQMMLSAYSKGKIGYTDVPCTRLDQGTTFPPPSFRAHSVPIIPSIQGPDFGEAGRNKLHNGGRGSSSYNLINPETEAEPVAYSSQSLASSSVAVQDPQTLTSSESALMSRGQIKHKSLVTYTTALGSGTSSRRAKTVISMTVLGSGAKTTQYAASLLSKATGGQEGLSAFGEGQQDDGLQTPFVGGGKDSSFSDGVRGMASLTYPKS